MWTLYKHTAPNGKMYIGITSCTIENRSGKDGRCYKPRGNNKSRFWNAIKKYGWNNFKHEIILDNLTQEEANRLEQEYIAYYKTQDKRYGYNITEGGNGHCGCESSFKGKQHTEEAKEKNRQAHLGKTSWNKGKHIIMPKSQSENLKIAMSGEGNPMYGKKHKEESKIKNRVSNLYSSNFNTKNKNWQRHHSILLIEYKNIL